MKAKILLETINELKISWTDDKLGFGKLTMKWDENKRAYILDSELMNVSTIIEIFKCAERPKDASKVFFREECVFQYCPNPEFCKEKCSLQSH